MVARPSVTAATFSTSLVLQIGKLSPPCPMKRVPSGMQSLVGPFETTAAGVEVGCALDEASAADDPDAIVSAVATWVGADEDVAASCDRAASSSDACSFVC